jgi:hypothetical protein
MDENCLIVNLCSSSRNINQRVKYYAIAPPTKAIQQRWRAVAATALVPVKSALS